MRVTSRGSRELLKPSFLVDKTKQKIHWACGSRCPLRTFRQRSQGRRVLAITVASHVQPAKLRRVDTVLSMRVVKPRVPKVGLPHLASGRIEG